MDYIDFCKINDIDPDAHYFFQMQPLDYLPILGFCCKSSDSPFQWVECTIEDCLYGKIRMVALNKLFGTERLYQDDFISLYNSNQIIKKIGENVRPVTISWIEPLCGLSYIVHTKDVLVDENWKIVDEGFNGAKIWI